MLAGLGGGGGSGQDAANRGFHFKDIGPIDQGGEPVIPETHQQYDSSPNNQ